MTVFLSFSKVIVFLEVEKREKKERRINIVGASP
jgi:hypothetical protein